MADKIKYKLKQEKGVLHVGGGRFFYPGDTYELSAEDLDSFGGYFVKSKAAKEKPEPPADPPNEPPKE